MQIFSFFMLERQWYQAIRVEVEPPISMSSWSKLKSFTSPGAGHNPGGMSGRFP
ncbi:uncharacterized protein PHALS_04334 [Plasmopara halstedii]|uniref:Uncharacterized protein n=1 Tax=Plasmopara halstedii TaxID=4781 RepID=A0A0P1B033_PLAHL|nr:uncharacterized protein PHALS_04334 [Plasmopara halstedii]CEG47461.1 hypothetical protein PHALS_04334 [Plasmopara halstedii]|eukprot:XP_024583830.1 hypothetical protein PHALS_04334 [Plasmopara halstedii]